jgi:hypothetical protein
LQKLDGDLASRSFQVCHLMRWRWRGTVPCYPSELKMVGML